MIERNVAAPSTRPRRGWPRVRPVDAALGLAVGVAQLVGTFLAAQHQDARRPLDVVGMALLTVGPVAVVARRRYPATVLVIAFTTTLAYSVTGYPKGPIFFALIVAFVNAVMGGRRLLAWCSIAAGYASFLWLGALLGRESPPTLAQAGGLAAWLLVLATVAEVARARWERRAEMARTREEESRRRASEERLRIARELHDVLAHNISLINVQAGVALHLMAERPEQARIALTAIKQASKEALGELRSVLDVLRRGEDEPPRAPAPGLDELDGVISGAAAAGLAIHVEVEGRRRPLPAGVDLAAFRIVQEALTNVVRHAGAVTATVRLRYAERDLIVQVDDDGRGSPSGRTSGGGNGIPGMRERAAALGGQLVAGPGPGGGFRVRAWFPLEDGP